jgi:hypothetical protein
MKEPSDYMPRLVAQARATDLFAALDWLQMTDSNRERKEILFDGFSDDEILGLPAEQIDALVLKYYLTHA